MDEYGRAQHFIDDKLDQSVAEMAAVVILGAGLDTRGYRLARHRSIPVFEVDQPVNIARKAAIVRRVFGVLPASVRLVPIDFERGDLSSVLTAHGYRPADRTFFVWEGVTQYLTEVARRGSTGLRVSPPPRSGYGHLPLPQRRRCDPPGGSRARIALFVWEGVTQYLTEVAVRDTLTQLSHAAPSMNSCRT